VALALVVATGVVSIVGSESFGARAVAQSLTGAGGEYHALPPERVHDTRRGLNDVQVPGIKVLAPLSSSGTYEVQILGFGGLPGPERSADVLAVAMNVTVVSPTKAGYLTIFGTGENEGTSSLVNFAAGQTVPNSGVIRPGADGKVSIRLVSYGGAGTAHVLIDVFGWFSSDTNATRGARMIPVSPGRIFDSRIAPWGPDPVTAGEVVDVQVRGALDGRVPATSSVVGALVNVTISNDRAGSAPTFVSVLPERPAAGSTPATSNLNVVTGDVKANLVMVPVGADGRIRLYNFAGTTELIVDVVAYLERDRDVATRAGRVVPLTAPFRVFDTRQPQFGATSLGPGRAETWSFADFVADVDIDGVPVGAQAAVLGNLTATGLTPQPGWSGGISTYLTAYPFGGTLPTVSNLNVVQNADIPNMALLTYGVDTAASDPNVVSVYNYNGLVHYLFDATAVVLAD
jgi:hypothetical protein